jgi:hypothetical protein
MSTRKRRQGDERGEAAPLLPRSSFSTWTMTSALGQQVAHVGAPAIGLLPEVVLEISLQAESRGVLHRNHKARFERWLDARDSAFVDVGFSVLWKVSRWKDRIVSDHQPARLATPLAELH